MMKFYHLNLQEFFMVSRKVLFFQIRIQNLEIILFILSSFFNAHIQILILKRNFLIIVSELTKKEIEDEELKEW